MRNGVIAVLAGAAIGTTLAVWTTRGGRPAASDGAAAVPASKPRIASSPGVSGTAVPAGSAGAQPSVRASLTAATNAANRAEGKQGDEPIQAGNRAAPQHAPSSFTESTGARAELGRARSLAERADVKALMALRDEVVQRGEQAGAPEAAAVKLELDQLDRYLSDARALRLRLDAQEFRKGSDKR